MAKINDFRFDELTVVSKKKIKKSLEHLSITENVEVSDIFLEMSLSDCIEKVFIWIKDDFDENIVESIDSNWSFDYQVTASKNSPYILDVLTCIAPSDPSLGGEIQYGINIVRASKDSFFVCFN